jgi:pimeloyl-ACP methyl ester carboxylesterase
MAAVPFRIKVSLWILALLAFAVLVGPLLIPVVPLPDTVPPRDLAYADSVFADVGGLTVHLQTEPPGTTPETAATVASDPAFLLLHGFGSQTMTWRAVRPVLGAYGLVLAYDRPAFGLTERPLPGDWEPGANPYGPGAQRDLALALLDAYGVERAVLIGHSAGGALALELALAAPERVAGVVLIGAAVVRGGGAPAWSRPLLSTPQMSRLGPLLMRQFAGAPGAGFLRAAYADPSRLDPVDEAAYHLGLRAEGWDQALWELTKASREPDLMPRLSEVTVPVLVLTGEADAIVPPEQSAQVAAALPRATLVSLADCGHLPQEECPDALAEALTRWLQDAPLGP